MVMKLFEAFLHLVTPRNSNNHRAKALQPTAITTYISLLLVVQIVLTGVANFAPGILGYASNITVADLLKYTNERRIAAGSGQVALNDQLSNAAKAKAEDMFAGQYWAHTSPTGRDPWSFIVESGYTYLFAGENLARDFGDSKGVVEAWMNSSSHKDNLLNSRYQDVGFAVVNGKYNGYETTLVVQMFGTKPSGIPTVEEITEAPPRVLEEKSVEASSGGVVLNTENKKLPPMIDVFSLTKNLSLLLTMGLLVVLVIDGVLAYRRRVVRLSGHNFAHLILLLALLAALNIIGRGVIL
jgi:uncharacterized protein YkwD